MFWDSLDDVFATVTNVAKMVAPIALPAAAAFGAAKLLGATSKEAWLSAGVAGATSGLLGAAGGNAGRSAAGSSGILDNAGIASGGISGTTGASGTTLPNTGQVATSSAVKGGGILDSLGIQGSDLLKLGGNVLASMDDTDDKLRERALDIRERERRVDPVTWNPNRPSVRPASRNPEDISNRRVI
jgi:hypothetical protein